MIKQCSISPFDGYGKKTVALVKNSLEIERLMEIKEWESGYILFAMVMEIGDYIRKKYPDDDFQQKFAYWCVDKSRVVGEYVEIIFERMRDSDCKFDELLFDALLDDLAKEVFTIYGENVSITYQKVIETLTPRQSAFPDTGLDYFLEVSVQLGILVREESLYRFANDEYFDYFRRSYS